MAKRYLDSITKEEFEEAFNKLEKEFTRLIYDETYKAHIVEKRRQTIRNCGYQEVGRLTTNAISWGSTVGWDRVLFVKIR